MRPLNPCVTLILIFIFSAVALADSTMEFSGGTNAGIDLITNANTTTTVHMQTSVGFLFDRGLELVAAPSVTFSSLANGSTTTMRLYGEVRYNLSTPIADAIFVQLGPGFALTAPITGATKTHFAFDLEAAKRFHLVDSVSWVPAISYQGTTTAHFTSEFQFIPFQFSLFI
jgi:hypothetical protein